MLISAMTEQECREVFAQASFGRLACSLGDQPYVVPVCFAYEEDSVYVFSTVGKKIEWMRANPKVCVQIDAITNQSQWVSVIANGRYEELTEPQFGSERDHARTLLEKRNQWWLNALAERRIESSDESIAPLFFRVRIDSMTGLFAGKKLAGAAT